MILFFLDETRKKKLRRSFVLQKILKKSKSFRSFWINFSPFLSIRRAHIYLINETLITRVYNTESHFKDTDEHTHTKERQICSLLVL